MAETQVSDARTSVSRERGDETVFYHLLNNPMISAFANVLKWRLKPMIAADVSGFTSSLSTFTA